MYNFNTQFYSPPPPLATLNAAIDGILDAQIKVFQHYLKVFQHHLQIYQKNRANQEQPILDEDEAEQNQRTTLNRHVNIAIDWARLVFIQGNFEAYTFLCDQPHLSLLFHINDELRLKCLEDGVAQNNSEAIRQLGNGYFEGKFGLEKNTQKGLELYHRASLLHNREATSQLAVIYECGINNVEVDESQARKLNEKADELRELERQHTLKLYEKSDEAEEKDVKAPSVHSSSSMSSHLSTAGVGALFSIRPSTPPPVTTSPSATTPIPVTTPTPG